MAEFGTAQGAICLQDIIYIFEEPIMPPEEGAIEDETSLQDVVEVIILHLIIDEGLAVVFVPLLSKLMKDHEVGLNKKIVTN